MNQFGPLLGQKLCGVRNYWSRVHTKGIGNRLIPCEILNSWIFLEQWIRNWSNGHFFWPGSILCCFNIWTFYRKWLWKNIFSNIKKPLKTIIRTLDTDLKNELFGFKLGYRKSHKFELWFANTKSARRKSRYTWYKVLWWSTQVSKLLLVLERSSVIGY